MAIICYDNIIVIRPELARPDRSEVDGVTFGTESRELVFVEDNVAGRDDLLGLRVIAAPALDTLCEANEYAPLSVGLKGFSLLFGD